METHAQQFANAAEQTLEATATSRLLNHIQMTPTLPGSAPSRELGVGWKGRIRPALRALAAGASLVGIATNLTALPATGPAVPGFEPYDQAIPALLQKWQIPGAAVAVAYKGQIVFARGYGYAGRDTLRPVQPDTRFRIMSVSKSITAAMVLKLVEDGRLSLDDHPFALLNYPTPTYSGAKRDARLSQITVRELLNHSAGWVYDQAISPINGGNGFYPTNNQREIAQIMGVPSPGTPETIIRFMVGQPLQANPGTVFRYSPLGYLILGRLIELKTGMTYEAAVRQFVESSFVSGMQIAGSRRSELLADEAVYYDFPGAPLMQSCLDTSQFVPYPYGISMRGWDAAGGLMMSAIECVRFLVSLDGKGGTLPLLQPASISAMRTAQYPATYYGYGWYTQYACGSGSDTGHGGGSWGSKTWALQLANRDWNVVVLLNSLPESAFSTNVFENEAYNVIHGLSGSLAPTGHSVTWSTLGWDAWQRLYFGATPSADLQDPDLDGVPNLVEYSAGLDPTAAEAEPAAVFAMGPGGVPVLTYRRILLEHPLSWTIEASLDGHTWSASQAAPSATALNADGTLSVSVPLPGAQRVRLKVRRAASGQQATVELGLEALPAFTTHPQSLSIQAGGSVSFTVEAGGEPAPHYQWQASSDGGITWGDIADTGPYRGARTRTLFVDNAATALNNVQYRNVATNHAGTVTGNAALLSVAAANTPRLINVSTRAFAGSGDDTLILGFYIAGTGSKTLLIRGVGPRLLHYNVASVVADPKIALYRDDKIIDGNDDWDAALAPEFVDVGAFELVPGSKDAAMKATLPAGGYTVHLVNTGSVAEALIEVYDLSRDSGTRLTNVSCRLHINAGQNVIVGTALIGAPLQVLVRNVGPELANYNVPAASVMVDPHLRVFYGTNSIAENDDWDAETGGCFGSVGAFPLAAGSKDAALRMQLTPGGYTVHANGTAGGVALVELYEAP